MRWYEPMFPENKNTSYQSGTDKWSKCYRFCSGSVNSSWQRQLASTREHWSFRKEEMKSHAACNVQLLLEYSREDVCYSNGEMWSTFLNSYPSQRRIEDNYRDSRNKNSLCSKDPTALEWKRDTGCSHRMYQETLSTAGNDIPTQQDLLASESFRDYISHVLSALKKRILKVNSVIETHTLWPWTCIIKSIS